MTTDMISEETLGKVRALTEIARRRGQTLAQMAVAWTLRDPRVTSALVRRQQHRAAGGHAGGPGQSGLLPGGARRDRYLRDGERHQHLGRFERVMTEPTLDWRCGSAPDVAARRVPTRTSGRAMTTALDRVSGALAVGARAAQVQAVPANRLAMLARYGLTAKAPALKDLAEPRRTATLPAAARHLEAAAVAD